MLAILFSVGAVLLALTVRVHVQHTLLQYRVLPRILGSKGKSKHWRTAERIYLCAESLAMLYYGSTAWPVSPVERAIARAMWLIQWRTSYMSATYGVGELPLLVAVAATCVEPWTSGLWAAHVANVVLFIS